MGDDEIDALMRAISGPDKWLRLAGIMDADQLERLLDGQLNVMIIFDHEFQRRFPNEHAAWVAKHDL